VVDGGLPEELFIGKVVRGAAGYLLLEPQSGGHDPALWFSENGLHWKRTHQFEQVDHWVQVSDIGAGDEGFVAVGVQIEFDETTWSRFALASGDGTEWFETAEPFGPHDPRYRPDAFVAALGRDWVATLAAQDDSARFWFSTDGLEWRPAGRIDDLGTTQAWAPSLTPIGDGLFFSHDANGLPAPYGARSGWTSTDGDFWHALVVGEAAVVRAAAGGPGWTVLAGAILTEDGESRAAFWYLPAG
jgi:hypothetical protein